MLNNSAKNARKWNFFSSFTASSFINNDKKIIMIIMVAASPFWMNLWAICNHKMKIKFRKKKMEIFCILTGMAHATELNSVRLRCNRFRISISYKLYAFR